MGSQGGGGAGSNYGIPGYLNSKISQRMAVDEAFKKDSGDIYAGAPEAEGEDNDETKKKVTSMLDEMNNMNLATGGGGE